MSREALIPVPFISICYKLNFNLHEKLHFALVGVLLNFSYQPFGIFSAFILKKRCRQIYFKILTGLDLVKNICVQ